MHDGDNLGRPLYSKRYCRAAFLSRKWEQSAHAETPHDAVTLQETTLMQQTPHDDLGDIIYGTLFVLGLLVATIGLIYATAWPCALCI